MRPPAGEVDREFAALPRWVRGDGAEHHKKVEERARATVEGRITLATPAWVVVGASLGLVALGVYAIEIASGLDSVDAMTRSAVKQLAFAGVGVAAGGVLALIDFRRLMRWVPLLAGLTIALLIFVLIPFVPDVLVRPINGARRWINVGFMQFQPSELAKVVLVLSLALYLRWRRTHRALLGLIAPGLITAVPMLAILLEPDLGTSLLFLPTLVAMLVAAGARLVHLFSACGAALLCAGAIAGASLFFAQFDRYPLLRPHQVERIAAVVDLYEGDDRYSDTRGFQGQQARMLIGAGQVDGHSEAASRALIHFSSLPYRHNDMVFAVIANRFGFVGVFALLTLYATWMIAALVTAGISKDPFGRLLIVGFVAMLATQTIVNLGMTVGLLPITGLTLPFVSYGGSSLLMCWIMVGLILSVGLRRPEKLWRESFEFTND